MSDIERQYQETMRRRREWLARHPDVSGGGNPTITRLEYDMAEADDEGNRYAVGLCRPCGREVVVPVCWDSEAASYFDDNPCPLVPMGTGGRAGCSHPKCGDKCPADFTRMVLNPLASGDEIAMGFLNVCLGIEMAKENGDETGERMRRENLAAMRAARNVIERATQ